MTPLHRHGLGLVLLFGALAAARLSGTTLSRPLPSRVQASQSGASQAPPPTSPPPPTSAYNVVLITSGAEIERAIGVGERHEFTLSIQEGQALRIAVDQQGADVSVALRFAEGEPLITDDESKKRVGRELSVWRAPARGDVRLTVRAGAVLVPGGASASGKPAAAGATSAAADASIPSSGPVGPAPGQPNQGPTGRYRLAVALVQPDEVLTRAVTASGEGLRLSAAAATATEAGQRLQEAVDAWRVQGDRELLAQSLFRLGRLWGRQLQRPADAIVPLTEALAIYEEMRLPTEIAATLLQIGNAHLLVGRWEDALAAFDRAYAHGAAIDPLNRAIVEDDLGRAYLEAGDYDRAVTFGRHAVDTFRAAGARRDEFVALERLSAVYRRMRRFDEALQCATEAIALAREHGTPEDRGGLMFTLGSVQASSGDDDSALVTFMGALDVIKERPNNRLATMVSIGRLHNRQGNTRQAREWLEKTLALIPPQLRDYWAATASELGFSLSLDGEAARALELQRKALEIVKGGRNPFAEMTVLRDLATTYRALGDVEAARAAIERASELGQTQPGRPYQALMLREQARNERQAGDLPLARTYLDAALEAIDSERGRVQSQALRASFGALSGTYYDDAIDVAMRMHAQAPDAGHDARAFGLFERSRARSLTDLLAEARTDIRTGVDPALLAEQRALQLQLGLKDTALRDLAGKPGAKERAAALDREIDDLTRRLAVLDARIRETSPRYAALTRPAALSSAEVQGLLDDDTVLLAFSVGPTRPLPGGPKSTPQGGYAWAVTRTGLRSFALPPTARIEALARKVHAGLAARQDGVRRAPGIKPATTTAEAAKEGAPRLAEIDREFAVDAAALSDLVLGPIAGPLQGEWRRRRLAIVATGPLEYIPFAALPAPAVLDAAVPDGAVSDAAAAAASASATPASTGPGSAAPAWLVDSHELVQLPSASVLAWLRDDERRRAASSEEAGSAKATASGEAPGAIVVMADAVYTADDPRVQARTTTMRGARPRLVPAADAERAAAGEGDILRGLDRDGQQSGFRRLVFSRDEARVIGRLAGDRRVVEALDFKASLSTITSPSIASARIVHIASHGIFNSARPELSGLVLSLVDERGQPQEGVLRLYDVFNLKLSADLVVLSGCQTGLGRQMRNEGLVGLTRAFMYAGAPRIVASLWQVDDLATSELMRRFYHGMLVRRLSAAAALRAAQQEMRASSRWRSPYYWAAFTLIGDWR